MNPPNPSIDIRENTLRSMGDLLDMLLIDRTTKKNIIWATDSYEVHGQDFSPHKHIKPELITGSHGNLIQPRAAKSLTEQRQRTKDKAEVFTPLETVEKINRTVEN